MAVSVAPVPPCQESVAAEHYDFRGFVGARNFAYCVVTGLAFGVNVIGDFEVEFYVFSVGHEPFDAAEIVVAQNDGGYGCCGIVAAVLLGNDDPVGAAHIVNAYGGSAGDEHGVNLRISFVGRVTHGIFRRRRITSAACTRDGINGIELCFDLIVR